METIDLGELVAEAGNCSRNLAENIRRSDYTLHDSYGIPNRGWTISLIADTLIDDLTGQSALNDRWLLSQHGGMLATRKRAEDRQNQRAAVRNELARLTHDGFCTLIDRLADATAKAA